MSNDLQEQSDKYTFTTSTGFKLKLKPVSPYLIQKVQQSLSEPEPPTYEVVTAVGVKEVHKHDSVSIQTASDEDKLLWVKYLMELQRVNAEINDRVMRLIILRGVETDVPEYGWDREQEEVLGLKVPKDPSDRKVHYILTEAISTATDIADLVTAVIALSGISQEAVNAARSSFRRAIRGNTTNGAGGPTTVTVEPQPAVPGG